MGNTSNKKCDKPQESIKWTILTRTNCVLVYPLFPQPMATGGFTKKTVDIEALMAQAAAEEKAAAEAQASGKKKKSSSKDKSGSKESKSSKKKKDTKGKDSKSKKDKKEKKEKKTKKERKTKRSKKNKGDELEPREIFGVPLAELVLEDGEMPEVFTDLITCLEGHGRFPSPLSPLS